MELKIQHHSQIREETVNGLHELFSERGFSVSTEPYDPGPTDTLGLPEAITIIIGLTIGKMIEGFFKKPGEELYLSFKNKFIDLIKRAREDKVLWGNTREFEKWEKEPTIEIPPDRILPALAWGCFFPFPGTYPVSVKFVMANDLTSPDLELAFDEIDATLVEMDRFVKWRMDQLRCKVDNPKWVLGNSYPGNSEVFLIPERDVLHSTVGGRWAFNVKFKMWVQMYR
jgi:hypothetical protein